MNGTVAFLTTHGQAALFACVLAEQLGLPLPAVPVLLAAGALGGRRLVAGGGLAGLGTSP